jgi:cell division protein FtsB
VPRLRPTRLLAISGIALVAFLYWKPLHTYVHTKSALQARTAEVHALQLEKKKLQARIAAADTGEQLLREARRMGLVKPNEQLFIVRGIDAWRHKNH